MVIEMDDYMFYLVVLILTIINTFTILRRWNTRDTTDEVMIYANGIIAFGCGVFLLIKLANFIFGG